ncbi:glycerol-3-phosphate responsive antiterminator [Geosporobacter ferrireducens]|uniref:Antiterminator n=1 Tax=Geosporobacter ferrireducens TaxID=1424294 RepID=A0A1D8GHP5_9FIRM|nr:glycerol-3-phosphate responsive antiterminator [Geosporobacter ferrireducens]AOT70429.1 antiterminator [Geosporobacter ferrireducens]MTI58129.1 glycerol-3-phosphate responsive antiterminator [Geosporobacter ferrireducens]
MGNKFYSKIQANPIVAAVKDISKLESAIRSPSEIMFLLAGNIFNLKSIVDRVKNEDMFIYIHIDLMEGFSKDAVALKYINENIKPDGIITTKSNLIKIAKDLDIFAIQRLFILDSLSLETGIKAIHATKPDAIEILPGIMPKVIKTIHQETRIPVIAGGLIKDKEDVIESLKAGAMGISTTREEVWYF